VRACAWRKQGEEAYGVDDLVLLGDLVDHALARDDRVQVGRKRLPKVPHDALHFGKVVARHDVEQVLAMGSVHAHEDLRVLVSHAWREVTCANGLVNNACAVGHGIARGRDLLGSRGGNSGS
jgi:hypothetical protein